jgi:hypothetical protein
VYTQAAIALFGRVTDLESCLWHFQELLTPQQEREVWRRLGRANCFDPYRPERVGERRYDLQLEDHDQRQVLKMLLEFEAAESGISMELLTTDFNGRPIAGETKQNWLADLPTEGRFQCEFKTPAGR